MTNFPKKKMETKIKLTNDNNVEYNLLYLFVFPGNDLFANFSVSLFNLSITYQT